MDSKRKIEIVRGSIWEFDPDPVRGREQGKKVRPGLIISNDRYNQSNSGMVIIIPCTTRDRGIPCHVRIGPEDASVRKVSYAMCEQIRAISEERLVRRWGSVRNHQVLRAISTWLVDVLDLDLW